MKLYVLAGGLGTRLKDLTKDTPKCMLKINGKPFLYYLLVAYEKVGIQEVVMCLGHMSLIIEDYVANHYSGGLKITFSHDGKSRLGTGGSIKKATQDEKGPFLVTYADSYLYIPYQSLIEKYHDLSSPLMVIYRNDDNYDVSNVVKLDDRIFYCKKNPSPDSKYIDYGVGIYTKKHFKKFSNIFDLSDVQEHFSSNNSLQFFESKHRFYEIGSFEGLEEFKLIIQNEQPF